LAIKARHCAGLFVFIVTHGTIRSLGV
jgi:hypothetical protein